MPYSIQHEKGSDRPWKVVKKETGKVVGSSKSKEKAKAMIKAMYANENSPRHGLRQMKEEAR